MTQKKDAETETAADVEEAGEAKQKPKKPAAKKKASTKAKPKPKAATKRAPAKRVVAKKAAAKEAAGDTAASAPQPEAEEQPKSLDELVEDLSGANRRRRQDASHELALMAKSDPEALSEVIPDLIDALYRPEAQTRWEVLNALAELAGAYGDQVAEAYDGAEASLFDEDSATVRLASFHYLASFGATSAKRSDIAWPLLDEAIQCYHGDSEYRDMLGYLLEFASGKISPASRKAMVDRISFDAENGRGYIKACSADIIKASKEAEKAAKPSAKKAKPKTAKSTKTKPTKAKSSKPDDSSDDK
jgi:hypothetical protein